MSLADKWNAIIDYIITQVKTISELSDDTTSNAFNTTTSTLSVGTLRAVQFENLQPGEFIDSFDISVNVAVGNVRAKIYDDINTAPGTLIGESDSLSVFQTGIVNLRLRKLVEIPQDGVVWIALENDNASLDIDISTFQAAGTLYTVAHTYGVGPSLFSGVSGTDPFWAQLHYNPSVVKHYGIRGHDIEDFFAIVSASQMTITDRSNKGSTNQFVIAIDLSFRGEDFQNGLTEMLNKSGQIYDLLHSTTLGGQVINTKVEIFPDEILEGERLYLLGTRILVTCQKVIFQV